MSFYFLGTALANQAGTSLVPLTAEIGPVMGFLGAIFVIVSMGLGLVQFSVALFNLAQERLETFRSVTGRRGHFLLALTPIIAVFLLAEWLSWSNNDSFTGILAILGVMVDTLMIGIFPILLLAASRRKGELVPDRVYQFMGNRLLLGALYLLFLSNLFFHGLFIWQNPIQRAGGILLGLLTLGITLNLIRRGAFAPRLVVELRQDQRQNGCSQAAVVAGGQPLEAVVQLNYKDGGQQVQGARLEVARFDQLQAVQVQLPSIPAQTLKVWGHRITPEGETEGLPVAGVLTMNGQTRSFTLDRLEGQIILPLDGAESRLEINL